MNAQYVITQLKGVINNLNAQIKINKQNAATQCEEKQQLQSTIDSVNLENQRLQSTIDSVNLENQRLQSIDSVEQLPNNNQEYISKTLQRLDNENIKYAYKNGTFIFKN